MLRHVHSEDKSYDVSNRYSTEIEEQRKEIGKSVIRKSNYLKTQKIENIFLEVLRKISFNITETFINSKKGSYYKNLR